VKGTDFYRRKRKKDEKGRWRWRRERDYEEGGTGRGMGIQGRSTRRSTRRMSNQKEWVRANRDGEEYEDRKMIEVQAQEEREGVPGKVYAQDEYGQQEYRE
jgi:hypothetical protein